MFHQYSLTQMIAGITNIMGVEAPRNAERSIPLAEAFAEKALAGEDAANVFGVYRAGFVKAVFIGRKPWKGYIITIR